MGKYADRHFLTDDMSIIEEGFDPEYVNVAESVFSIGNEYMGVRGYFDEGYSRDHLQGSYFNGIYEFAPSSQSAYKGVASGTEYMVNSVDWLYVTLRCDGEKLDMATSKVESFKQKLDFSSGVLSRTLVWKTASGKEIRLVFERLVSMEHIRYGAQRITLEALTEDALVEAELGLKLTTIHKNAGKTMWVEDGQQTDKNTISVWGHTEQTNMKLKSIAAISAPCAGENCSEPGLAAEKFMLKLGRSKSQSIEKVVKNYAYSEALSDVDEEIAYSFNELLKSNIDWWSRTWQRADIVIEGDIDNQQGIRFCIFQLFQTYHGAVRGTNIGAKGLTGEAYNGNAFWDTETYCLPFFLWNDKSAAKNLLYFRYKTLEEARRRADALDCKGAFYPIATISGRECCNLWQHASLQLQASTAVAYGIWLYEKLYSDDEFLEEYGLEMLIEISRMLATRGAYDPEGNYGYYGVMGPDEFQIMVNNNCYTNYMGRFTLDYTLDCLDRLSMNNPDKAAQIKEKLAVSNDEVNEWENIRDHMLIPYDEQGQIFEQHDGFFKLPHIDIKKIPVEDFPLYSHWSYDRIYRNDMIKQPDVLMLMLLFNSAFTKEQIRSNYEFYEPRCIHESSLSPSVHSILACQLGKKEEAFKFFEFATRMDLDNYNRNTGEGIHTTSIAAAWMNIVYGFGGLRCDGEHVELAPVCPDKWKGYSFRLNRESWSVLVKVKADRVELISEGEVTEQLYLYGEEVAWDNNGRMERRINGLDS